MARRIRYTEGARADFEAMLRWQTQPGAGAAAIRRIKSIRAAIQRLRHYPCLYAAGAVPGVRELPCGGYRVIYEVAPDTGDNKTAGDVRVLRIFGPGQLRDGVD